MRRILQIALIGAVLVSGQDKKVKPPELEVSQVTCRRIDEQLMAVDGSVKNTGTKPIRGLLIVFEFFAPGKQSITVQKGAPDTYIAQWKSGMAQLKGLSALATQIAPQPDRLEDVLSVLFRIQSLEITAGSLNDGLRRYQNPALAELLSGTLAESTPSREKLQQFALALAADKEKEFQIVDKEAQRCRGNLTREAPKRTPRAAPSTIKQ